MLSYTFATVHYLPQDTFNIEKKKNQVPEIIIQFPYHNCDVTKCE